MITDIQEEQLITVIAKCPLCKRKKTYKSDKPLNYTPHCDIHFFVPMIISKVTVENFRKLKLK